MKLHGIEVKNLNSLYGETKIDFHRDLKDAPIFLIVGPTGAGKSTLMDAVSLALFGQTPRLTRERGQKDRESGLVMSHGTGECFAAIEFSKADPDGKRRRYRAEWSCQRARKKPDGKLQDPQRSLSVYDEDGTKRILVSGTKAKDIDPCFAEVLQGFTVEDFQRSVLLAQGEFSAFLKATDQQRAAILERLTRTDIYKRIGQRTAELKRDYEKALAAVEQHQKGIQLFTAEQVAEIEATAIATATELARVDEETRRLAAWEAWLGQIDERRAAQAAAAIAHGEAEAALAARAPDFTRLDEDASCREAGDALRSLQSVEGEVALLDERMPALQRSEAEQRAVLGTAEDTATAAKARREEADAALDQARPKIAEARARRQAWQSATGELGAAERGRDAAASKVEATRARLDQLTTAQALATSRRESADARRRETAPAEPLVAQIAGLTARAAHVTRERVRLDAAARRRARAEGELAGFDAEIALLADRRAQGEAARASLDAACAAAEAARRPLLGGAASVKARREALETEGRALAKRAVTGREARSLLVDLTVKQGRIAAFDAELAEQAARIAGASASLDRALALREPLAREAAIAAERFADWTLIRKLSDEREKLQPGSECPLCGSREHPFVGAREEERADLGRRYDAVKLARDAAQAALEEHDRQAQARRGDLVQLTTSLTEKKTQRAELDAQANEIAARVAARLDEAGLPAEADAAAIDAALADLDAQASAILATRSALDDAEEALKIAEEARRAGLEALAQWETKLAALDARRSSAEAVTAEQSDLVATLEAEILQAAASLREDLAHHGIAVRDPGGAPELDAALGAARALAESAEAAAEEQRSAEAAEREARAERAVTAGQHEEAAARLAEHREAFEQRRAQVDEAQRALAASLDGADPDALERSLKTEAEAAQRALAEAEPRAARVREELARITTRREEAEVLLVATQARVASARVELGRQLAQLALPDAAALAAKLLTDEERRRLIDETSRVRNALVAATARRDDAEQRLAAVAAARPADADAEESTGAEVGARRQALEARRGALHQQVGRCQEQLDEHRRKTKELASVVEQIDRARRDHDIWQSLHNLIGKNNGEQFKEFAQILNLQELIDKANARLRWLAPRYSLTVAKDAEGQPRLSFAVRDAHFAGAERPPTTLSGGETFLVSLALALALADYRAVEMPIETLLLDEGFGTLDTDTLNTAMDALERLQARGTQIGIISHLGGLRERIEARIVVGKLGNGRSEVRFELGVDV